MDKPTTFQELYGLQQKRHLKLEKEYFKAQDALAAALKNADLPDAIKNDLGRAITERFNPRFNELDAFMRVLISLMQDIEAQRQLAEQPQ